MSRARASSSPSDSPVAESARAMPCPSAAAERAASARRAASHPPTTAAPISGTHQRRAFMASLERSRGRSGSGEHGAVREVCDQLCGAARYGNVAENDSSLAPTLSVHNGSWNGSQYALVGFRNELKIAVSPTSTTSSVSLRPPYPLASAHESQPAVLGLFVASTTRMSGYSTLPRSVASSCGRAKLVTNASVSGRKVAVLYGCVLLYASWCALTIVTSLTSGFPRKST